MAESRQPPAVACHLTLVSTRLNPAEARAFALLQKDLGHEGHGAQAETVREVLRDCFKQRGYLGRPKT